MNHRTSKCSSVSALEMKLDELRQEIASSQGVIFPHAVLSSQQITLISNQKPTSTQQLEKLIGKLKTEKYGSRIISIAQKFAVSESSNGDDKPIEGEGDEHKNVNKRRRKSKAPDPVIIQSSEDG